MRALLRALAAILLAVWTGGVAFLPVVAALAFRSLPSTALAGGLVRSALLALHAEGLILGSVLLLVLLAAGAVGAYPRRVLGPALCVAAMLALTAWSQFGIIPRMERDRLAAGGDISLAAPGEPRRAEFDRLHRASEKVEEGVLLAGLVALALLARGPSPGALPAGSPAEGARAAQA